MVAQCSQSLCQAHAVTSLGRLAWALGCLSQGNLPDVLGAYSTGAKIVLPRLLHAQTPEQDTHVVQVPGLGAIVGVSVWR